MRWYLPKYKLRASKSVDYDGKIKWFKNIAYVLENQVSVRTSFHPYEKIDAQSSIKSNYENMSGKYANVPDQDNNPYLIPEVNPYDNSDVLPA